MLSFLCNDDLQFSPCKDFCAALMFARAAVGLQNPKVWKEVTKAGRTQVKKVYLNIEVHKIIEKNKTSFYKISYGKASTSLN